MALTRIISDLHYGDPTSWLQDVRALTPLAESADHLIVNGDALDTQVLDHPAEVVAAFQGHLRANVARLTCITGNHDPDISDIHELFLAENQVWVTHGDVFFDDIAPWGRLAPEIRRRIRKHVGKLSPAELQLLEHRFRIFRQVCLKLPREHDPNKKGFIAAAKKIARAVFPPHRVLIMMKVWNDLPALAARVSAQQRPDARFIITGHTHYQGHWPRRDGRVVINTGSFCPPRGGNIVDLEGETVTLRKLVRKHGEFRAGTALATYRLARSAALA